MTDAKIYATVTVLTYNSERTLEACLRSVAAFDEILVLDGGSTDRTLEIARSFGARIESQSDTPGPIADFTIVRQRSFDLAKHDWIFWLDSDEFVDEILSASIRDGVAKNDANVAYRAERVPIVEGRVIRYASFTPDMNLRLVNRKTASWARGKRVHEHLRANEGVTIRDLVGAIFTPWTSMEDYRRKDRYYISLAFSKPVVRRPRIGATSASIVKNLGRAVTILCTSVILRLRYGQSGAVLPFRYEWRFARYHLLVVRERIRQFLLGRRYVPPSP